MENFRLVLILILIILALRKKVPVGVTLFGAGIFTAILFGLNFKDVLIMYLELLKSERFIFLTLLVILITILGALLKKLKFLTKLSDTCRGLPGGNKTAVVVLPGMIGLMPMPGGSLLSAPLVNNVLDDRNYPADLKMLINYWFRHAVETFWPIYPCIILTEAITGMPIYKVSMLQFPLYLLMLAVGLFFFLNKIQSVKIINGNIIDTVRSIFNSLWPILLTILIYAVLKIHLVLSILISIFLLVAIAKPSIKILKKSIIEGLSINLIFLIFGILSFQMMIEMTGTVNKIHTLTSFYNLPSELIIFIVCFSIGILTGMISAYIGLGYSILAGYLYQPNLNTSYILIAFYSGFLGFLLSPSHLCLTLTNQYFKSNIIAVYKQMIIPLIVLTVLVILLYLSGWAELF